jgi:hypothetical protein
MPALAGAPILTILATVLPAAASEQSFLRGDANADGIISLSDVIAVRRYLFAGVDGLGCLDAADADDDGTINLGDAVVLLNNLFGARGLTGDNWLNILPEPYPVSGQDPTSDALGCQSFTVTAALTTSDELSLGEVTAQPGATVDVPIVISSAVEVHAIQLVVAYDPGEATPLGLTLDGGYFGPFQEDEFFAPITRVQSHPGDGVFTVAIAGGTGWPEYQIPPGEDILVASVRVKVAPSIPPGTIIDLEPTNGDDGSGVGPYKMKNELTSMGDARYLSIIPRTAPGLIRLVVPDFLDFVRADVNSDGAVNISDPISALNSLFLAGDAPACPDAADANDNGSVEISDPIHILTFLYAPSRILPGSPPLGICVKDLTDDNMGVCYQGPCRHP